MSLIHKINPDRELECDVLVIGAGLAGICAAIAAARGGCGVIILEREFALGGNSGPDLGVHISGAHSFHPFASETGILAELEDEAAWLRAKTNSKGFHYNISRQWDLLLAEFMARERILILRRHVAFESEVDRGRIQAVWAADINTGRSRRIRIGACVIEASGDGLVARKSGALYFRGREGKEGYNERSAPEEADDLVMGSSITALARKSSVPIEFFPPPGTPEDVPKQGGTIMLSEAENCLFGHASWSPRAELCFLWCTETGGEFDTVEDDTLIYRKLIDQMMAVWDHIKNKAHAADAREWELIWVAPRTGKRESFRFEGDYVLTQTDIEQAREFDDAVAYGGYAIDEHVPLPNEGAEVVYHSVPPLFSIPFRCLYSKNIDNLFFAGRLISVSHLALCAARLMKTLGTAGQAVGEAAALCRELDCSPRDIYEKHIAELQRRLLAHDATILNLKNHDPEDLAPTAKITASSQMEFKCERLDEWLPCHPLVSGVQLWDWAEKLECVELFLKNENSFAVKVELKLSLAKSDFKYKDLYQWNKFRKSIPPYEFEKPLNRMEWGDDHGVEAFAPVAMASAEIPPDFEGWVKFDFKEPVELIPRDPNSDEDRYLISLEPQKGISWGMNRSRLDFMLRVQAGPGDKQFTPFADGHLIRIHPAPAYGEAANIINGFNRRFATNPVNMWMSDPGLGLPQWVQLDFGKTVEIRKIHLCFDTLYRGVYDMPFNNETRRVSGMLAKTYELQALDGDQYRTVVSENENRRRFRIHEFQAPVKTNALRLLVRETWAPGFGARVYEIRVY